MGSYERSEGHFHKVFNTCVENLTEEKYFPARSASAVHADRIRFARDPSEVLSFREIIHE